MPLSYKDTSAPLAEPVALALAKQQCVLDASFTDDDGYICGLIVGARQYVEKVMQRAIFPRTMSLWLDYFPYWHPETTVNPDDRDQYWFRAFRPKPIKLPKPGCLSVDLITYVDPSGVTQTLAPSLYALALNSEPARIQAIAGWWPMVHPYLLENVQIDYVAGTYVNQVAGEAVVVPAAAPYKLPLAQIAQYVGMVKLVDASGNPVAFTDTPANLTAATGPATAVAASYAGQTLTAAYSTANCPQTIVRAMLLLISHWYNHRDAAEVQPPKEIDLGVRNLLAGEIFDTFGF